MASIQLTISGMTCGHCTATVENALKAVDGVWGVHVDLEGGTAEIDCDDRRTLADTLVAAVETAGYGAAVAG
jgi:Cu+-exporting ATPase